MAYQTYFYTKILSLSVWGWYVRECFCLCVTVWVWGSVCKHDIGWCKKFLKNAKNQENKYVTKNYWSQEFSEKSHACMYICLNLNISVWEYVSKCVCVWVCVYLGECVSVWECLSVSLYMCEHVCVFAWVCVFVCVCVGDCESEQDVFTTSWSGYTLK